MVITGFLIIELALWAVPVIAGAVLLGGAHAVLSFVAQRAVEVYGCLHPRRDGKQPRPR